MMNPMETLDLTQPKHQLVTMPIIWLLVIFAAGWTGKSQIINVMGLAQASDLKALTLEVRMAGAFQTIERAESNLDRHENAKVDTSEWRATHSRLERKVELAREYKTCVLGEKANCHLLQKQLWQ